MTPKHIIIYTIAGILTFIALYGIYKATSTVSTEKIDLHVTKNDWIKGDLNSKKIIVEYSDFQCPACKGYQPLVNQVIQKYQNKIAFVYRHFPLSQHKNSFKAAMSAEAAGKQGKFWEMHDLLFKNQNEWAEESDPTDKYISYAQKLGLNIDGFKKDLQNTDLQKKIKDQMASGDAAGVNATPTFYVNGIKLENIQSLDDFDQALK